METMAIIAVLLFVFLFKKTKNGNNKTEIVNNKLTGFQTGSICSKYEDDIFAASIFFKVPAKIIDAIVFVESSDGANTDHANGEIGIMAVSFAAATDVLKKYPQLVKEKVTLFDSRGNIALGTGYLRMCFDRWGNWEQAVVAYNSGINNPSVNNWENNYYLKLVQDRLRVKCS